ncbi:MAG: hypothetical protein ACON4Z_06125 [Planctomycetota bacterium]
MTRHVSLLLVTALAGSAAAQALPESGEVALKTKIQRRQKLLLPGESATAVATGFHFAEGLGADFRADVDGEALLIDADADGELETRVEGDKGFVVLEHGGRRYGVSLVKQGEWRFVAGSVVQGEVAGTKVRVVDQNHNGRFDDVGEDALVIGNGRAASFLSEVVSIGGQLRKVEVAADGSALRFSPYTGAVGKLSLHAVTDGKVMAAVLNSTDKRYSVHLSKHDVDVVVPAGNYELHSGVLSLAGSRVDMAKGRSKAFSVTVDGVEELAWGGPAKAEFAYQENGDQLTFDPNAIWFYGSKDEEYKNWNPVGKSPLITVVDRSTGAVIAETRFPGSC